MGTTGIDAEFTTSATGYIVEASITEAALENSLQFNPGNDLRLTFIVRDGDGGTWSGDLYDMFAGTGYRYATADEFVILSLTNN